MQLFQDVITYQNTHIQQILISDLHLAPPQPAPQADKNGILGQAFLALLDNCLALPKLQKLYILGDWFEAWLGDDVTSTPAMQAWLVPTLTKLCQLSQKHCKVYVMTGNRDFLLGQTFCDRFGGQLIHEPYYATVNHCKIRLEHGDALCTDDKKYQYFRKVIQHPLTKKLLLAQSLKKRDQIAQNLRQKSEQDNRQKSMQIMDVNPQAVTKAVSDCDILIHGHTHRPQFFLLPDSKARIVLGDWRVIENRVEAVIGVMGDFDCIEAHSDNNFPIKLVKFEYVQGNE